MNWQIPSPRAMANMDPYECIYLTRDAVQTLESSMVEGIPLESEECLQVRSTQLNFPSFSKTLP